MREISVTSDIENKIIRMYEFASSPKFPIGQVIISRRKSIAKKFETEANTENTSLTYLLKTGNAPITFIAGNERTFKATQILPIENVSRREFASSNSKNMNAKTLRIATTHIIVLIFSVFFFNLIEIFIVRFFCAFFFQSGRCLREVQNPELFFFLYLF